MEFGDDVLEEGEEVGDVIEGCEMEGGGGLRDELRMSIDGGDGKD